MTGGGQTELVVSERITTAPITADQVVASIRGGGWCADLYGVKHQGSLLAVDGRTLVCLFRAPDAEAVRHVQRQAGLPFDALSTMTACSP